ncbi:MAG: DUF4402 domain-containing protein [Alphaproteobacteria bacterium]|nr:DUF4402 domain-containing protein [Alphaproteobacteria bacterium]
MRKYFLLGAVAILTETNVNASAVNGTFTANVTLEKSTTITCNQSLNFGTVVFSDGGIGTVHMEPTGEISKTGDVVSVSGATNTVCQTNTGKAFDAQTLIINDGNPTIRLSHTEYGETFINISVGYIISDNKVEFGGDLAIDNPEAGTYTGTVNFAIVY